ncbi:hypothetical protein LTR85_009545 [Meristemomyces frigidus]|nr:hypothetical protein LTR85_009545 [Meristemomyces frigidus]
MARRDHHRSTRKSIALLCLALLTFLFITKTGPFGHVASPLNTAVSKSVDVRRDPATLSLPSPALDETIDEHGEDDSIVFSKRGILDSKTYNALSQKGATLLCYLSGVDDPPAGKGQSQWTQYSDLTSWGWGLTRSDTADYNIVATKVNGVDGINVGSLENGVKMEWHHQVETSHGTPLKQYPPTNGQYINIFWPADGVLFANDNYSPDYMITNDKASVVPWKDAQGNALPTVQLRQWSDVVFLSWAHITTAEQQANLRYVFRRVIRNEDTINVINTIARKKGLKSCFKVKQCEWQVPVWPGIVVEQGDDGFTALLGSPNGRGVAWLLVQHKAAMGKRTVKSIRMWNDLPIGNYQPSMMMELVPTFEGPAGSE